MQPVYVMPKEMRSFNSGLCGCFDDCGICLYGCCLPCCLYGDNVSKVRPGTGCFGSCLLYYCCAPFACLFAGGTRTEVRQKFNLHEEPCSDCCVHCWCSPCGLCQEARELKHQGFVAAQQPQVVMAQMAPVPQAMNMPPPQQPVYH